MKTEKGKRINADNYVGDKTKIASARIEQMKFGTVVRIESEELEFKGEDELPDGKTLRASKIFGIAKSESDESLVIIEGSKFDKFLSEKNIKVEKDYSIGDSIEELKGVAVIVQKTEDGFLDIA